MASHSSKQILETREKRTNSYDRQIRKLQNSSGENYKVALEAELSGEMGVGEREQKQQRKRKRTTEGRRESVGRWGG